MNYKRAALVLILIPMLALPSLAVASQNFYLSSAPTGLNVSAVPKTLPANGQTYDALVVTTMIGSTPAEELTALNLTLSSSNPSIIAVPNSAVIAQNTDSVQIPLTTSMTPGVASITVSAPDMATESITVPTVALINVPTGFNAVATPRGIFFTSNTTGIITISLVNSAGMSVVTNTPVVFTITPSSDNFSVPAQLVVQAGSSSATTSFLISSPGAYTAVISSALGSKTVAVSATYYGPTTISAVMFPGVLGAGVSSELVVSLLNNAGVNIAPLAPVVLTVTSSNDTIISPAQQNVTLAAGSLSTTIGIYSSVEGKAAISVSANGYPTVDIPVTIEPVGSTPVSMKIITSQQSFALSTEVSQGIGVELINGSGYPAVASSPIQVTLSSSNPGWSGSFAPSVTIPAGAYFVSVPVTTGATPGSTTVTASAQNFYPATTTLNSNGYVPTKLAVTPLLVKASPGIYQQAAAFYLTDNAGLAYPALTPVQLQGSVSGLGVSLLSQSIGFQPGDDLLLTGVNITAAGSSTVTYASSLGSASYTVSGEVIVGSLGLSVPKVNPLAGQPYTIAISYISGSAYAYNQGDITGQLASSASGIAPTAPFDIAPGVSITYVQFQPEAGGKITINTVATGYTSVGAALTIDSTPYTLSVSPPSIMYVGQVSNIAIQAMQNGQPVSGLTILGSAAHGEKITCTTTNSTGYSDCKYTGTQLSDTLTFSIKGVVTTAPLPVTLITNGNTAHAASSGLPIGPIVAVMFIIVVLMLLVWKFKHRYKSGGSSIAEEEVARLEEEANKPEATAPAEPLGQPATSLKEPAPNVTPEASQKLPLVAIDEEKDEETPNDSS